MISSALWEQESPLPRSTTSSHNPGQAGLKFSLLRTPLQGVSMPFPMSPPPVTVQTFVVDHRQPCKHYKGAQDRRSH